MYKISIFFIFIVFSFTSCNYFDRIFNKNPNRIDFTSVDEYPMFPSCDSLATIAYKQKCFENTLAKYIQRDLEQHKFSSPLVITDALIIHINVDENGKASLQNLEASTQIKELLPELEALINESIVNFPTLIPAKKRGLYVNSKYIIPLYIVEKTKK